MPGRVVYFGGEFVPEHEARVSIFDSALMFGDMAFEVTRTFKRRPFKLGEHIERLFASLKLLEIDCGLTPEELEKVTRETLERNLGTEDDGVDWQILHDISRGPLGFYRSVFGEETRPTVIVSCYPLIGHLASYAPKYGTGVDLVIPAQRALPADLVDAKAKTRSRLHYQMAQLQAARMGDRPWPVLVDPDGFLAEGPGWNIFLVKDGVVYTPELRNILGGVSRATILELASVLDIEVREANLGRYEALQAEEIFCTATTFCMLHAATFEGQRVGTGRPGRVFRRLSDAWNRLAGIDVAAQAQRCAERLETWESRERAAAR